MLSSWQISTHDESSRENEYLTRFHAPRLRRTRMAVLRDNGENIRPAWPPRSLDNLRALPVVEQVADRNWFS
jgi:hypothetical protein